jgi:hypothetical protein
MTRNRGRELRLGGPKMTKAVLTFAAIGETVTGLAFVVAPALVVQVLLGKDRTGIAVPIARVAGIALVGLGIALWPSPPLLGMLTYSTAVALYLAYVGISGVSSPFLWPVVALHAVLSVLLSWSWLSDDRR